MPSARLAVSLTSKTCSATFRTASRLSACFSDGSFRICWTWSVYCWTCSVGGPATAAAAQPSTITTAARAEPLVLGMRPPPPLQVKLTQTLPAPGRSSQEKTCAHVAGMCLDRKSTRLNSSHLVISYAVFCLKKKKQPRGRGTPRATIHHPHVDVSQFAIG